MPTDNRDKLFHEIIDTYSAEIVGHAYFVLRDAELAKDACQQVLLKVYQNIHRLKKPESIRPWVTRITFNTCYTLRKSKAYRESWNEYDEYDKALTTHRDPYNLEEAVEVIEEVWQMLNQLPPKYATVLFLRYYRDYTTEEIAHVLRIPHATVRTRIKRALEKIRKNLNGGGVDIEGAHREDFVTDNIR